METINRLRKKRTVSFLAAVALSSLVITGLGACTSGGAQANDSATAGPVTLKFWSWVPGMEKAVAQWNAENPKIKVDFTRIAYADSTKIPAAVEAGTGPDIAQFSQHALPDYVIKKEALDITQYVGSTKNLYTASAWNAVSFGGKIFGVPQDIGPGALMYRKDIFAKYGIDVPKTWNDYIAAAKKLHAANPNIYIAGFYPNDAAGTFYQDMVQAGGSWYGRQSNAWTVKVNSSVNQKVAARYQTLVSQHLVKTEQMWTPGWWHDINAGTIASINDSAWMPANIESNAAALKGDWAVAPSPSDAGDGTAGDSGGAVLSVMKTAKDPQAAAKFMTWLDSSKEGVHHLIVDGGLFPAAKVGFLDPAMNKPSPYFGGQVINSVFEAAAKKVPSSNVEGPGFAATSSILNDEFGKVAAGAESFVTALDNVQAATIRRLKGQGLSVK